jgi:hypothetical protein
MDGFVMVCTIMADLSQLSGHLTKLNGPRGVYWSLSFEVGILFGRTELAAILIWEDANVRFVQSFTPLLAQGLILLGRGVSKQYDSHSRAIHLNYPD